MSQTLTRRGLVAAAPAAVVAATVPALAHDSTVRLLLSLRKAFRAQGSRFSFVADLDADRDQAPILLV